MQNLLIIVLIVSLAACSNPETDRLEAENKQLEAQLLQCQEETLMETARANAAEEEIIKANKETVEAKKRASESAVMALEIINRVKNKK